MVHGKLQKKKRMQSVGEIEVKYIIIYSIDTNYVDAFHNLGEKVNL